MPTLYVTEPGARLEREANQLVVVKGMEVLIRVPGNRVDGVVLTAGGGVTTPALHFLLEHGIDLLLTTGAGEYRGRLAPAPARNVELRHTQHLRADDASFRLAVAQTIVAGKIRNCRTMIMRWDDTNADPDANRRAAKLALLEARTKEARDLKALMGLEGAAAAHYFAEFGKRLREPWLFTRRLRRPPPDPVNCLLSIAYTLLYQNCVTAAEAAGLDSGVGFLHGIHHGRASLAVDLMEEFRPVIADSVVLTVLNKRMLRPEQFQSTATGGVTLAPDGWSVVATQYQKRLNAAVRAPGRSTRTTCRKLLEIQARQLRATIEGAAPAYEPFRIK